MTITKKILQIYHYIYISITNAFYISDIVCGQNEIYYPCPVPSCAAQTCENIGKKFNCPNIPANYPCKGECRCQPGFYRNKFGQCVSEELCSKYDIYIYIQPISI